MRKNVVWKKVCCIILCFSLLAVCHPAFIIHAESPLRSTSNDDVYGLFATWFIASDIYENPDSGWNLNTAFHTTTKIYDTENRLIGYTFELTNGGQNNGYVFVRNVDGDLSITEFSYDESPLYHISSLDSRPDKVYYASPLEYYIEKNNKLYTIDDDLVLSGNVLRQQNRGHSRELPINPELLMFLRGSVEPTGSITTQSTTEISDIYQYILDNYGSGWTVKSEKTLNIPARLQSSFESNVENCTLSSLTQAFYYFRSSYSNIPSNINTLYNDVKEVATEHGYTPSGGTPPTKIDNIITDIWKKYNYNNGKGNNDYIISFGIFKGEIDNNRPALFNMANGYYANHTVLVKGYRIYEKSGILNSDKNFLRINDNWTTGVRWIDYSAWSCCGSVSRFVTP